MARIRSIHPGLFTDEAFASLSMAARVMLLGLWTESDDQGVFEWKPVTLKMRIFSADNLDVVPLLNELTKADAVRHFSIEGKPHGAVRNFCKYQKPKTPKYRELRDDDIRNYVGSKYPKAEMKGAQPYQFPQKGEMTTLRDEGGDSLSLGVGNGEGAKTRPPARTDQVLNESKITAGFVPSDPTRETIRGMGFGDLQYNGEFGKFIAYYMARGATRADWNAALISWFQRATPEAVLAGPTATIVGKVLVIRGTPGWNSWISHIKETRGITWSRTIEHRDDANRIQEGWWWPTEYAPGYDEATGEKLPPKSDEAAA